MTARNGEKNASECIFLLDPRQEIWLTVSIQ